MIEYNALFIYQVRCESVTFRIKSHIPPKNEGHLEKRTSFILFFTVDDFFMKIYPAGYLWGFKLRGLNL